MDRRGFGSLMGVTVVLPPTLLLLVVPRIEGVLDCAALMASRSTVSDFGGSALDWTGDPSIPARVALVLMRASLLLILIFEPEFLSVCTLSLGIMIEFVAAYWIFLPLSDMERPSAKGVDSWWAMMETKPANAIEISLGALINNTVLYVECRISVIIYKYSNPLRMV